MSKRTASPERGTAEWHEAQRQKGARVRGGEPTVAEKIRAAHAPREPKRLRLDGEVVSYVLETGRDGWEYVVARVIGGVPTFIAGGERKSYSAACRGLAKALAHPGLQPLGGR